MSLISDPEPVPSAAGAPDADFFQAASYVGWVQGLVAAMAERPAAVGLFDASMPEPSSLLRRALHEVVDTAGRPRVKSVMGQGNPLVVQALARRYGVEPSQVLCTAGALSGVAVCLRALAGGGHVLIERPHLDTLYDLAAGLGARVETFERNRADGRIDLARLSARLRPNTRAIILTNLHNPTGAYLAEAELKALAGVLADHPAKVIVDEVYVDFALRRTGERAAASLDPAFVSVNSLSKVYGLGALKCGWIVADPETIARIAPVYSREEFGVSKLTHAAASIVLEDEAPFAVFADAVLHEAEPVIRAWAGEMASDGLIEGEAPPFGCLYFPRLPGVFDTRAFAERLWREHAVAVAPGELFQRPGHVRIGFGRSPETLERALAAVGETLRNEPRHP